MPAFLIRSICWLVSLLDGFSVPTKVFTRMWLSSKGVIPSLIISQLELPAFSRITCKTPTPRNALGDNFQALKVETVSLIKLWRNFHSSRLRGQKRNGRDCFILFTIINLHPIFLVFFLPRLFSHSFFNFWAGCCARIKFSAVEYYSEATLCTNGYFALHQHKIVARSGFYVFVDSFDGIRTINLRTRIIHLAMKSTHCRLRHNIKRD